MTADIEKRLEIVSVHEVTRSHITKLIVQLSMDDPDDVTCMTFVFRGEDHTLGNALRYMIMKK